MKRHVYGFILAIQFFTIIPIRKEVQMTDENIEGLVRMMPFLGILFGSVYAGITYALIEGTTLSPLMIAFIIWLLAIILTGALHLDGWIDTSDAFFSYRDREKRLEIMVDPQTGAFGVISVVVLLITKFIFIYEVMLQVETLSYLLILFIPFFSRILTGMVLILIPSAKESGLGYYFQQAVSKKALYFYVIYLIPIGITLVVWSGIHSWMILLLFLVTIVTFLLLRKRLINWFGGTTGDVTGASQEGMEVLLWIVVSVLHSFVMG